MSRSSTLGIKRKISAGDTAPESPLTGPISSMMVRVKLREENKIVHAKKRFRWDDTEGREDRPSEKRISHNKRYLPLHAEENDMPKRKKHRVSLEPLSEDTTNETRPKELASAMALASLAFSFQGATNDKNHRKNGCSDQTREEEETDRTLEEHQATRDIHMVSPTPANVSPDASPEKPPRKVKKVCFSPGTKISGPPGVSKPKSSLVTRHDVHTIKPERRSDQLVHAPTAARASYDSYDLFCQYNQRWEPPSNKSWFCDFCKTAAFASYTDACEHEENCKFRFVSGNAIPEGIETGLAPDCQHQSHMAGQARKPSDEGRKQVASEKRAQNKERRWFTGTVPLSIGPSDDEWLSEVNCFIRERCMEAFSATVDDITRTSKRGRIVLHQVGVRCKFCASRPLKNKPVGGVSYPTSIAGIYESVKRWQKVHLPSCQDVPDDVKKRIHELQSESTWVPTTRQYWADSARALGMVDTTEGIRFRHDPRNPNLSFLERSASNGVPNYRGSVEHTESKSGIYIALPEDQDVVPPFVYSLMRQVELCHFTEADRFVARSKGPIGFAGFQCRHCAGHAGLGKYFPVSSKSLSTNSTSQNMYAHMMKCRRCPKEVKKELEVLKMENKRTPRLVPGWRRTFFERVWNRLHGD